MQVIDVLGTIAILTSFAGMMVFVVLLFGMRINKIKKEERYKFQVPEIYDVE